MIGMMKSKKAALAAGAFGAIIAALVLGAGCATNSGKEAKEAVQATPVYPASNEDTYSPGDGWTLSWSDEFNQSVLDENVWTRQAMKFPYNNEMQQYLGDSSVAYTENGYMVIKAARVRETNTRGSFTSARVISNPGGADGKSGAAGKTFLYGKIAARIQLPYGRGLWPAFWMLGDNVSETGGDTAWPVCGEIDILESGSNRAPNNGNGTVSGALHHDPSPNNTRKQNLCLDTALTTLPDGELMAAKFRVFEIEWDQEKIVWKLDGVKFGEASISEETRDEFHKEFYAIFNIAVGGNFTVSPDDETPFPQFMYVDWIRHYTR